MLESAQRFLLKGQLDKAIKDYQQVVALEPKEIRFRQKLAELLVRDNRKDEAIVQYEDIGKHYADNSYFLKAIAVYKQIQRLVPESTAVILTLASLNHRQGLIGNALAEYGQAVALLEKEGNLKEAVKALEQMIAIDDARRPATRLKHAELLFASGDGDASCQAFGSLLASLRADGDAAAVQRVSDRMRQLFPERQELDLEQIAAQVSSGEFGTAIASLQERLKRDNRDLQAWELLCDAERRKGNLDGVRLARRQMSEQFPEETGVLEGAVRCEMEAGDFRGALALLELHLPRFLEQGKGGAAEALFLSLPGDAAKDPRVVDGLTRIYQESGATEKLEALKGRGAQSSSAPGPFGQASEAPVPEPPDPFGAASSAPAQDPFPAAAEPKAAAPAFPWEEEIELDLEDDFQEAPLAAAPDVDIALDFSLDDPFGEAEGDSSASPFGELQVSEEASPGAVAACGADPFVSGATLPQEERAAGLEPEQLPLELALPEDDFPGDMTWADQVAVTEAAELPEPAEIPDPLAVPAVPEVLEAPEAPEAHEAPEVHEVPEVRQLRGWEEIFPDAANEPLDLEELESHYDLGIGYKEMGLYNAAIKEFAVAATNPQRRLDCLTLQAICYREKGEPEQAEELLKRGLDLDVLSPGERTTLNYELAFLSETVGAVDDAIALYREVLAVTPDFHDVAQRLAALAGEEPCDVIDLELEEGELQELQGQEA